MRLQELWRSSEKQLDILNKDFYNHGVVQSEIAKLCSADYTSTVKPIFMPIRHLLGQQ